MSQKLWKKNKITNDDVCNFESILVAEVNAKQNPDESCTNRYKKHIACSYGYKLISIDHKFSQPLK